MDALKNEVIEVIETMNPSEIKAVWNFIFSAKSSWGAIPEAAPDEFDLKMLGDIESDSNCREFISSDELKQSLGW